MEAAESGESEEKAIQPSMVLLLKERNWSGRVDARAERALVDRSVADFEAGQDLPVLLSDWSFVRAQRFPKMAD